jgi:RNA polymerase sigma-70 factor (ECF subfamily)
VTPPARDTVTAVLTSPDLASRDVVNELLPLVYDELRAMARRQLARERHHLTLDTTGLVHEAYLRLVDQVRVPAGNRAYFFGAAARAMHQILVDAARRRSRLKRGAGREPIPAHEIELAVDGFAAELLDIDAALGRLVTLYPRQARVVECRFFGGLSVEETAAALDLAPRTVKRDWALARAWLFRWLRRGERTEAE